MSHCEVLNTDRVWSNGIVIVYVSFTALHLIGLSLGCG